MKPNSLVKKMQVVGAIGQGICTTLMILGGMIWLAMMTVILLQRAKFDFHSMLNNRYSGTFYEAEPTMKAEIVITSILLLAVPLALLWLFRKLFGQFAQGMPMTRFVGIIALGVALTSFLIAIYDLLCEAFPPLATWLTFSTDGDKSVIHNPGSHLFGFFKWLLIGLLFLGVHWGIRQAIALKEENDLTV